MQQPELESATRVSSQKTEEEQLCAQSDFPSLIGLQPVTNPDTCSSLPMLHESQTSTETLTPKQNVGSQSLLKSQSHSLPPPEVTSAQDTELQPEALLVSEPQSQASPEILKPMQECTDLQSQTLHSKTQTLLVLDTTTTHSQCQHVEHFTVVMPQVSPLTPSSSSSSPPLSLACSLLATTQSLSSATAPEKDGTPAGRDGYICELSVPSCTAESSTDPHLNEDAGSYDLSGSELIELDPEVMAQLMPQQACTIPQRSRGTDEASLRRSARGDGVQSSSNSKWQHQETLKLIELYKENRHYFEDQHYKKKTVWSMLAAKLAKVSKSKVRYTGTQVSNRWKNLTKMYRDCVRGVPLVSRFQYFDQLQSVFGGSKVIATSQSLKQRRQGHSLRRARPTSANTGFVTIAPKKPAHQPSIVSTGPAGQTAPFLAGSKQTIPALQTVSASDPKPLADVVSAVRKVHEDHKKRDAWKLDQLERMHKEKMQLFTQFLDLLKDHHQKN